MKFIDVPDGQKFKFKKYVLRKSGRYHGVVCEDNLPIEKGEKISVHATENVEVVNEGV